MSGPPVAVATVRAAVRRSLAELPAGAQVLVACSGGADSLALAAATRFESRAGRWRAGLITVDHGLQAGSADRAADLAAWAKEHGFDPATVATVRVEAGAGGPEAAARTARYEALDKAAAEHGAAAVLLGHTEDDQAETVLLGLARGSGARSLAGMPQRRGLYRRPLLGLPRELVRTAALDAGLPVWEDPHNTDPAYARSRVRATMRALRDTLGDGLAPNLARTARLLRADADALDAIADTARAGAVDPDGTLPVVSLTALPDAVRTRVIRGWLLASGVPAGSLSAVHIDAVDAVVTGWHGQGPVGLPRDHTVTRRHGRLHLAGRADL
ncbi:MAG TPA: tRNA lysidine(34) synthetase TilS [Mycobacteriales bacterium]|jgi:tRNA(Ile)-lysidine synthase|nr:tRNA lysidine(34) synthetase TilS [Mycobacteriales bacterium]